MVKLNYAKSRGTAKDMFQNYVRASRAVYRLDDKEIGIFNQKISEAYILEFYVAWKMNDTLPRFGEHVPQKIEQIIPREIFTKEMARMVMESLLAPLLEVRTQMWSIRALTSVLDRLGHHSFALIDYEGRKAPINIILPKTIEAEEGWSQLRLELLGAFLKIPQSVSAPVIQMMVPHATQGGDGTAAIQHVAPSTPSVVLAPTRPRTACPTTPYSPISKGKAMGDRGPTSRSNLSFKMPDPSMITATPMPPSPTATLRSSSVSSNIWERLANESADPEAIGAHLAEVSLASNVEVPKRFGHSPSYAPAATATAPVVSALTQENVQSLEQSSSQLGMTNLTATTPSKDPRHAPPISTSHAGELYGHHDKDRELTEMDISVIVLLAQSVKFNEVEYRNTLIKRFDRSPSEAYLLAKVAAANRR
ncbi:uncharacterized protein EI90DRAFT_3133909 [Cantharellus anzutake]|uniref:uncharacterized protein n=1 Tax=Cantharellus anzutake TaxID=1750568 RepID=UPI001904CC1C|nr:uncharacterized protein EI90DRAFT_3133909 [Cantharellus anzutake]KAF8317285.1 hypothetical protein EI90DRAFT_3133909 [Cantharellus anzutake]